MSFVIDNCNEFHFLEVIVGKSMQEARPSKRFGYVTTYDTKPKRRLYDMLQSQGMQMNQFITFFTNGDEDVRELPFYLNPDSKHYLDWFHITMQITVLKQMATHLTLKEISIQQELERIKWYLWHGITYKALEKLDELEEYCYMEIYYDFVESTVNEVVSKRMVKKHQMRWTKKGAHLLLQLRIRTLNNELKDIFCGWYPQMKSPIANDCDLKLASVG